MARQHLAFAGTIITVIFIYFLTHFNNIGRDLVSEESLFLIPGRNFFEGLGYQFYWGETVNGISPLLNPFHKPPLTSLLLGAFSFLSPDGVMGARLVPFLIGLSAVITPLILTRSLEVSLLILISPFFYAASSHMQTDPTVGIAGYLLVCCYWYEFILEKSRPWLFMLGTIVLWLGKIEVLVIAMFASAILSLVQRQRFKEFIKLYILSNLSGLLLFVSLCWALGRTAEYSIRDSAGHVIMTILNISKTLSGSGANDLLQYFNSYHGMTTLALLLAPFIGSLFTYKLWTNQYKKLAYAMGILFLVPSLVYLKGGYQGDGFPRYLLILFIPLSLLAGKALHNIPIRFHRIFYISAILLFLAPPFTKIWNEKGNITVGKGITGTKESYLLLKSFTKPNDLILGMERMLWYGRDRRWLTIETFAAYPDLHKNAESYIEHLDGAVIYRYDMDGAARDFLLKSTASLESRGFEKVNIGSYIIYIKYAPN